MMQTDHWDKRDYLAFVLLYLAGTDGVLEAEELRYIAARLGKDHLDHIQLVSADCNDIQCLEVMKELRPRFYPGEIGLESLKMEMHELCTADGRYSQMEERIVDLVAKQL
ncbi:MAG: TerB family tellurite resistance protein [Saprospiraceae bacterium]|jgi:hypothetical protein|nr:TerB family tellurite resistance protein [Saprospiraceae bacterium]